MKKYDIKFKEKRVGHWQDPGYQIRAFAGHGIVTAGTSAFPELKEKKGTSAINRPPE